MPEIDMSDCPCCNQSSGGSSGPHECCVFEGEVPSLTVTITGTGTCNIYSYSGEFVPSFPLENQWEQGLAWDNLCNGGGTLTCTVDEVSGVASYVLVLSFSGIEVNGDGGVGDLYIPMTLHSCSPFHLTGSSGPAILEDEEPVGDNEGCVCEGAFEIEITE